MIESVCVIVCMLILAYACYQDIKERSVTNLLWLIMIAVGIPCALYTISLQSMLFLFPFIYSVSFTFVLAYLFFKLHLFGGADAKSLMGISVLIPQHTALFSTIFDPFPFAVTTLINAALISSAVPLFLFLYNLLHRSSETERKNFVTFFIGYKLPIAGLEKKRHLRLVHDYYEAEGGEITRDYIFGGIVIDKEVIETLKRYYEQGKIERVVWVTPELPFMLFITAGFALSLLYGNVIAHIMAYFMAL